MLLHWIFVLSGLNSNTKENFKIHLEIPWKIWKKKNKMFSSSSLAFGPLALRAVLFLPASSCLARSAS
jgi:hypothetical protein